MPGKFSVVGTFRLQDRGLVIGERHPHWLGDTGCIDQAVTGAGFKQHCSAVIFELENRRQLLKREAAEAAHQRLAAHADLVERRLDLVERQGAGVGKRQPRAQEDRGRRPVSLTREEG